MSSPRVGSSRHGRLFWAGMAVGGGLMAFGFLGLREHQRGEQMVNWFGYLVGLDLLHDALVAPLVSGVGVLVARLLPRPVRAPVQAGLFTTTVILLVAAPPLMDTAERVGNPTIQPLDYGTATLTAVAIAWGAVVAATVINRWVSRRRRGAAREALAPG